LTEEEEEEVEKEKGPVWFRLSFFFAPLLMYRAATATATNTKPITASQGNIASVQLLSVSVSLPTYVRRMLRVLLFCGHNLIPYKREQTEYTRRKKKNERSV
jgi:hypothetical protein